MLTAIAFLVSIGAGAVGGIFFAFSSFVMKALAQLPARDRVCCMRCCGTRRVVSREHRLAPTVEHVPVRAIGQMTQDGA